LSLSRFTLGC